MEYIKAAVDGAKNLIPPSDGASDHHVRRWRMWIAMATFLNACGLTIHVALACGFAAPFYSGFAHADDMSKIAKDLDTVQADMRAERLKEVERLLLDTKEKHCAAQGQVKRLYLDAYNNLRSEYFDLRQREAPDPPCEDFK